MGLLLRSGCRQARRHSLRPILESARFRSPVPVPAAGFRLV